MEDIRQATSTDYVLQTLAHFVSEGFPDHRFQLPVSIRSYWNVRSRLSMENGLILCGTRIVVPRACRQKLLHQSLSMHHGGTNMRERARLTLYWPRMDSDIETAAHSCSPCNQHLPSLPKETMANRHRPTRAFEEAHADLFAFGGEQFLVYVDDYSGWPSITRIGRSATSKDIIKALRLRFCEKCARKTFYGWWTPIFFRTTLKVSPRMASRTSHIFSSLRSKQRISGGVSQANEEDYSWIDAVQHNQFGCCNTTRYNGLSPAEMLFGHAIRDLVSAHRRAFEPTWQLSADRLEKVRECQEKVTERYNSTVKDLLPLRVGDKVVLQDPDSKRWERCGGVVERTRDRQYLVRMRSGRVLRRNRRYLRKRDVVLPPEAATKPVPVNVSEQVQDQGVPARPRRIVARPHRIIVDPKNVFYL